MPGESSAPEPAAAFPDTTLTQHPYRPAWWCRGAHCQTLWPFLFRRAPRVPLKRERLELPDGDFLDLDWTDNDSGPIVVILHGLEGSSKSQYARGILAAVQARGWRGVLMHFRGCSGEPNRLARGYHSGETGDLAFVLERLRGQAPLAVVGYSLGGNVLLKYLGETGNRAPLAAAVAVSVPYRLADSARQLDSGFSRVYQWNLVRRMRASLERKRRLARLPLAITDPARLRTFYEFDEHVTAPLHGFRGADHYYAESSSRQYLKTISIPTLLIHAKDDPFMTADTAPAHGELSTTTRLELYPHGGHVGFVAGRYPWHACYWLEDRIPKFLGACFPG